MTGKPVLVPKPTSPASSITTPLHPSSLPSCPMGLPFPASGPPHTLFPLSGVLLQPHMSPHYLLITLQGSLSILESPWPSPGPVLLQRGLQMSLCVCHISNHVPEAPRLLGVRDVSEHPGQHPRAWCRASTAWSGPAILGGPSVGKPCLQLGLSSGLSIARALRMGDSPDSASLGPLGWGGPSTSPLHF